MNTLQAIAFSVVKNLLISGLVTICSLTADIVMSRVSGTSWSSLRALRWVSSDRAHPYWAMPAALPAKLKKKNEIRVAQSFGNKLLSYHTRANLGVLSRIGELWTQGLPLISSPAQGSLLIAAASNLGAYVGRWTATAILPHLIVVLASCLWGWDHKKVSYISSSRLKWMFFLTSIGVTPKCPRVKKFWGLPQNI